ncbi:hypothetical protein ACFORL_01065 [Legionella dresdenensis]|uniref:Phasin domain-containing protein n=1 Tax=Legionella dresdenensis TaxID=450200 RepID=A0ABV8CBI7_9GAMM
MSQQFLERWTEFARNVQKPIQAMTELQLKTLQNISYVKPDELSQLKKPELLLEKQVTVLIENGHKALDFVQKSFEILENSMMVFGSDIKSNVREASSMMKSTMQTAERASKPVVRAAASNTAKTVKKAKSTVAKASSARKTKTSKKVKH